MVCSENNDQKNTTLMLYHDITTRQYLGSYHNIDSISIYYLALLSVNVASYLVSLILRWMSTAPNTKESVITTLIYHISFSIPFVHFPIPRWNIMVWLLIDYSEQHTDGMGTECFDWPDLFHMQSPANTYRYNKNKKHAS